jgi:hypothetical protein
MKPLHSTYISNFMRITHGGYGTCTTASLANSEGTSIELSIWTCALYKSGKKIEALSLSVPAEKMFNGFGALQG